MAPVGASLINKLKENQFARRWVCASPQKLIILHSGEDVMDYFLMSKHACSLKAGYKYLR